MDFDSCAHADITNKTEQKDDTVQNLCKNCGKCCKVLTTSYSHDELKKLAEEGDEEAKVFTEIFRTYPSIEEARKVVPEQVDQILEIMRDRNDPLLDDITFYYCPNVTKDNKCPIYEKRPNCCRIAPKHGWTVMPPGCGFEGWQYEQREKHKKTVRALKEYLYMAEQLFKDGKIPNKDMTVEELRKEIEEKIKPWEKYGAMYW